MSAAAPSTSFVLGFLPAFLLSLGQMPSPVYRGSLWSRADLKHYFSLPFTGAGVNNRHVTLPARVPSTTSTPAPSQLLEQPCRLSILAPPRVRDRQKELLLDSNNPPQGSAAKNRDSVQEQRNSLAPCSGFAARDSGSDLQAFPQKRSGDGAAQAQHRSG